MNDGNSTAGGRAAPDAPVDSTEPAVDCDPIVEVLQKDVDRALLRQNLRLTVEQRVNHAQRWHESIAGWREAGRQMRGEPARDGER